MLRTNELRLVPDMPIRIAMECHGNRVATCSFQPRCRHAGREHCRAVLPDRHESTPLGRSQMRGGSVPRRGSRLSQKQR